MPCKLSRSKRKDNLVGNDVKRQELKYRWRRISFFKEGKKSGKGNKCFSNRNCKEKVEKQIFGERRVIGRAKAFPLH
jgi:hypothetical protein